MEGMEKRKIAAGIVTYNPDMERLERSISTLLQNENLSCIYVADNFSDNIEDLRALEAREEKVMLIELDDNMGVAKALNRLCQRAMTDGNEWLLTLDQDSLPEAHFIDHLAQHIPTQDLQANQLAILSPRIEDVNMGRMYSKKTQGCEYIKSCITAGSMVNIACWQVVGGFDDAFFIDGVDFDYCLRVRLHGFKIMRIYSVCLHQEIGKGKAFKLGTRRIAIMNHNPERIYYITRNYLTIGKRYHQQYHWTLEVLKRVCIVALFESQKLKKLAYFLKGIRDFERGKMGELATKRKSKKRKK